MIPYVRCASRHFIKRSTDWVGPSTATSGLKFAGRSVIRTASADSWPNEWGLAQSVPYRRQACSNAIREIGRSVGRLRGRVDQRAPAQLVERQRGVDPARVVEIAVDEAIEEMTDVEPALAACGIQVANDVDRAAVAQEVIPFRPVGKLVDPFEVDQQQLAHFLHPALRP